MVILQVLLLAGCWIDSPAPLLDQRKFSKAPNVNGYFYDGHTVVSARVTDAETILYGDSSGKLFELKFVRFPQANNYIVQARRMDVETRETIGYLYFGAYIPADGSGFRKLTLEGGEMDNMNSRLGLKYDLSYKPTKSLSEDEVLGYFVEAHERKAWGNVRTIEHKRIPEQQANEIMVRQKAEEANQRPRYDNGRRAEPRPRQ